MEIDTIHLASINWEVISAIGQVGGAFATLLAVYVALFQINKTKPRHKMKYLLILKTIL